MHWIFQIISSISKHWLGFVSHCTCFHAKMNYDLLQIYVYIRVLTPLFIWWLLFKLANLVGRMDLIWGLTEMHILHKIRSSSQQIMGTHITNTWSLINIMWATRVKPYTILEISLFVSSIHARCFLKYLVDMRSEYKWCLMPFFMCTYMVKSSPKMVM